ncbi:MAG: hypothetical protein ACKV0T_11055 [Planctomycetales bacterium]
MRVRKIFSKNFLPRAARVIELLCRARGAFSKPVPTSHRAAHDAGKCLFFRCFLTSSARGDARYAPRSAARRAMEPARRARTARRAKGNFPA